METREYEIYELEAEIEHLEMVLESKDRKIKKLEVEIQRLKAPINNWLVKGLSKEQLEKEKIQAWKAEAVKEAFHKLRLRMGHCDLPNEIVRSHMEHIEKEMVGEG